MFKVSTNRTFSRTVTVCVPVDGGFEDQTVKATYRVVPDEELSNSEGVEGQKADLRKMIVSLDDLVDDDKQPVSYSEALLEQLIAQSYVRIALLRKYIEAVTKVKKGN